MTPGGISNIKPEDRLSSFIIYTDIDMTVRVVRLSKRDMPGDSLTRRIEADEADFMGFNDYDLKVTNPDF
jgi:hypothetical protein